MSLASKLSQIRSAKAPGFKALVAAGFHDEFECDPDWGPRLTKDLGGGFRVDVIFDIDQDGGEYVRVELNSGILTYPLENEGEDEWPTVEEAIKALKGVRPDVDWMTGTNFSKAETDAYVRAYEAFDAVEL